jgi:hypothetical protein
MRRVAFQYETADAVQLGQRACSHVFRRHIYPKEMPKKPAVVYLLAGADSQGRRLEAGKNYRLHVPNDMPVSQFWALTQRPRRIESRDSQRLLCYLRDDLCDVVCIFVGRVVVELVPEAGIDYGLLQTYIGIGGEVSSFPNGTCSKVVGAQLQRDELAFGRAEENGNYLLSTWQLLSTMVRGLPVIHGN